MAFHILGNFFKNERLNVVCNLERTFINKGDIQEMQFSLTDLLSEQIVKELHS